MKTRNLFVLLMIGYLGLGLSFATAQSSGALSDTTVTETIEEHLGIGPDAGFISAITAMVARSTQEATELAAKIAEVNTQVEMGYLSREEGDARIKELEENFELEMENLGESMEAWGESFGERMEAWGESFEKRWDKNAKDIEARIEGVDPGKSLDTSIAALPSVTQKESKGKTSFDVTSWSFGANSMVNTNLEIGVLGQEITPRGSYFFALSHGKKQKVFGPKSPLIFEYGLNFSSQSFNFSNDKTLEKIETAEGVKTVFANNVDFQQVKRNSWNLSYFEAPIMLHFDFSGNGKVDQSLSLGVGAYAGVRVQSITGQVGTDIEGQNLRINTTNNLNTNLFRAGLQAQVGYKKYKVTGRLDATPLFHDNAFEEETYIGSIGIGMCL